ncbi:MAG: hypothetical protein WC263_01015 [Candidatus Micrarchaeia archaeon]|jgi:DNA-binding XRE family transcriptional regulator
MKNNISGSRKRLGLTQEQLAEKCDVSPLAFAITRALGAKKIEDVFDG